MSFNGPGSIYWLIEVRIYGDQRVLSSCCIGDWVIRPANTPNWIGRGSRSSDGRPRLVKCKYW